MNTFFFVLYEAEDNGELTKDRACKDTRAAVRCKPIRGNFTVILEISVNVKLLEDN